jgi:hypothetical protein
LKSLVTLHLAVLRDAGLLCDTTIERDAETLIARWEHEGDSYLTITLPLFVKALERGLRDGVWPKRTLTEFGHRRGLPVFLRGFLLRVFDEDGQIKDAPDANAIWAVRQIGNLTQKIERDCTPARVEAAFQSFIRTDSELEQHYRDFPPDSTDVTLLMKSRDFLFGDVLDRCEKLIASFDLIPRHGPGAVADRLKHPERWDFPYWTERLESVFPSWRYTSNLPSYRSMPPVPLESEIPVRVIAVPKTQKTPRLIAIEPSAMQFAQQGLKAELYRSINQSWLKDVLGFTDQERNQRLALAGSVDGSLATLDLSEASDRVAFPLVEKFLERWPHTLDFVSATRSGSADVNGSIMPLFKFASMGSALTFPIEAMVFTAIAHAGLVVAGDKRSTTRSEIPGILSVYGDDIIVPVTAVDPVIRLLETFGFKVNGNKSFWTGRFRESCGKEYYAGTDVSIVRLRADFPSSRDDAALIGRLTDFRNRAYRAGLWGTVKIVDDALAGVLSIPPRHVDEVDQSPFDGLALDTVIVPRWRGRYDPDLQTWFERYPSVRSSGDPAVYDGEGGLLKWFLENHERSDQYQTDRFESQERAHTFRIKWVRAERLPKRSVV